MTPPACLIFDCDGVLVDSEALVCALDAAAITRAGYPITGEEMARRFAGVPGKQVYAAIEAESGIVLPASLFQEVKAAAMAAYRDDLRALPGALVFLKSLKIPYCVASSSEPTKLALEMALHEEHERRALEGELWRLAHSYHV